MRVHTCSGHFHDVSTAFGGAGLTCIQFSHLRAMFSISLLIPGHQKYERAIAFMQLIPACVECNSVNRASLNLLGIITLYPHIKQSCSVEIS